MRRILIILGASIMLSASAYSCAVYHVEVERQETARMAICVNGGGKWITAWNWKTYCVAP